MRVHRLNLLFSLASLNVLVVTIERFSFTTDVVLQPYSFMTLHEVVQMTLLILATVVLPYFLLHYLSDRFALLHSMRGTVLGALFIIAIYFYATGNGVHETASYLFNQYCDTANVVADQCGSMFFNDYYWGNILYFCGAFLLYVSLILIERLHNEQTFTRSDLPLLIVNAVIYAFTIFAYAAFDRVLVGIIYAGVTMVVINSIYFTARRPALLQPFTLYCAFAYTLGTVAAVIVRFAL